MDLAALAAAAAPVSRAMFIHLENKKDNFANYCSNDKVDVAVAVAVVKNNMAVVGKYFLLFLFRLLFRQLQLVDCYFVD